MAEEATFKTARASTTATLATASARKSGGLILGRDALETTKLMLVIPDEWNEQILDVLQPLQSRQDFIRMAIREKLEQLPKKSEEP